jgi:hypothetical protein
MKRNHDGPVKIRSLEVIHWSEPVTVSVTNPETGQKEDRQELRHPILCYAIGEDGVLYELSSGKWFALPINPEMMHEKPNPDRRANRAL